MAADRLPEEILTHVLTFLSVGDRKQSALVCRKWYEATLAPSLQKDVIFRMMPSVIFSEENSQSFACRKGVHLTLNGLDGSFAYNPSALDRTASHIFPKLISLCIVGSDLTETSFANFLSRCTNLVSLSVAYCDSLVMSGTALAKQLASVKIDSLKDLDLSHMRHLSDQTMVTFLSMCPRLESLRLASNSIVFKSSGLYYDPQRKPSSGVLTFACLRDFLSKLVATLRRLDLSATAIDDASLIELVTLDGLCLHELSLASCHELSATGVAALCTLQPELHSLNLSHGPSLTDGCATRLTVSLPRLRQLLITKCLGVTGVGARALLSGLRELELLNLSGCYLVDDDGFTSKTGKSLFEDTPRLSRLELSYCGLISDHVVIAACFHLRQLQHLDLTSCVQLSDISASAIARSLPHLVFLSLAWCKNITDFGVMGLPPPSDHVHNENEVCKCIRDSNSRVLFSSFPPVRFIAPLYVPPPTEKELERIVSSGEAIPVSVANLSHLTTLRLAACTKLTDGSLSRCIRFVQLQDLDLDMCYAITDVTLFAIAENNPSLERLSVAQCTNVTDAGIARVLATCCRLVRLNISGCTKLTDHTLRNIQASCQCLKYLDVSLCNMDGELLEALQNDVPSLSVIHKRHTSVKKA